MLVHGGGFIEGNRGQMAGVARSYARRGFVTATISYRLNPNAASNDLLFLQTALGLETGDLMAGT